MRNDGFFLIEVMVVSAIAVTIAALFSLYTISGKSMEHTTMQITAGFLAQKQLAYIKGDTTILQKYQNGIIPWQDIDEPVPIKKNGVSYVVNTTVATVPNNDVLKKIVVVVSWEENHMNKQVSMATLVSCHG
jgi:signal peptidase I